MLTASTDDGARLTIWVRAELNAGLVAAAIPPLKSLFENLLRNVFGVRSQFRSTTAGYGIQVHSTRQSRARDLEDDEIAIRSYSVHVSGDNKFRMQQLDRKSADVGSSEAFEDPYTVGR